MKLAQRATSQREKYDFFVHAFPGGGKSGFILDSYWERDGKRGGPVIFDFDQGGIIPTADDMRLGGKIPIFSLSTEEEVIYSCTYLDDIIKQVNNMPEFADYQVDLLAYDTLSSMEEMIMGETKRAQKPDLPASPGSGILATGRRRDPDDPLAPALQDYKAINIRTKAFIRRVRELPINTIITCHTVRELEEDSKKGLRTKEEDKRYGLFPDLVGKNRYTGPKYHDFYLYMFERQGRFFAHTRRQGAGMARTKFMSVLKPEIQAPKFWDLIKVAQDLRLTNVAS